MITEQRAKLISEFEGMLTGAKLNSLCVASQDRPLTDTEFKQFKDLANEKLAGRVEK